MPSGLLSTLQQYQTLVSSLIALLAAIVAYTNISRQLTAQRNAEDRQRRSKRDQLASALAGEISGILYLFSEPVRRMELYYRDYAKKVRDMEKPEDWWSMGISGDYMTVYKSVGSEIGELPGNLPENIAKFYVELQGVFDRISAAESGIYILRSGKFAADMAERLAEEIARTEATGKTLIEELKGSRAAPTGHAPIFVASGGPPQPDPGAT